MESASSGAQQLMFRAGQLREDTNIFWGFTFKDYRGLRNVTDVPLISLCDLKSGFVQRLTSNQLEHYRGLMGYLKPLMQDSICFQQISMVMLLDTSDLSDNDDTNCLKNDIAEKGNTSHLISETSACYAKKSFSQRFQEIKSLHKHYVRLFHSRCIHSNTPELEALGGTEQLLNSTMQAIKQIAYYCSLVGRRN